MDIDNSVPPPEDQKSFKMSEKKQPRKRNRIPVACSVCRKRKVKCDRARPHCEVCQRYNVAHLCFYQEPAWSQTNYQQSSQALETPSPKSLPDSAQDLRGNSDIAFTNGGTNNNTPKVNNLSGEYPVKEQSTGMMVNTSNNKFDNNINNLINHSSSSVPLTNTRHLGFDNNILPFQNYRNINPPQSSERSTANFNTTSNNMALQHQPFQSSYNTDNLPRSQVPPLSHVVPPSSNNTNPISNGNHDEDSSPVIQSELERMKQKIKEIEASITLSKTFAPPSNNGFANRITPPPTTIIGSKSENNHSPSSSASSAAPFNSRPHYNSATNKFMYPQKYPTGPYEPYIDPNEVIDFYAKYISVHVRQSRAMNHGPLSWLSMLKRDHYLKILWLKIIDTKKRRKIFPLNVLKRKRDDEEEEGHEGSGEVFEGTMQSKLEREFRQKMLEHEGIVDIQPYKKGKLRENAHLKEPLPLGLSRTKQSNEMILIKQIEEVLPTKKVVWLALDRFFKFYYPVCPYVDQGMFLEDITKIIGERSLDDVPIKNISLEKRLDFADIGLLLLFIRFGFLAATSNAEDAIEKGDDQDAKYLLRHPVGSEIASVAQSCLNQFKLLRKTTMGIFQLSLYMRLYHGYSPEEGDGPDGGDSMVFGGMLVQMGISIGLNRDPLLFGINDKAVNLWRKLWTSLVISDSRQANVLGNPPSIRLEHFDTEPAVFVGEKSANNYDLKLEKLTVETLNKHQFWSLKLRGLSDLILNMKNPPRLIAVVDELKELESYVASEFGSLGKIMTLNNHDHVENVLKAKSIAAYLEIQTVIQATYYHIFLYFEEKKDCKSATYYLKKNLNIIVEIISSFFTLLKGLPKYIGNGFDTFLTPKVEMAMHRTVQIQLSLVIRAKHFKCVASLQKTLTPELDTILDNLCDVLLKNTERYLNGLAKLSDRYYYAWRMSKAQSFILEILRKSSSKFFELNKDLSIDVPTDFGCDIMPPNYNVFQDLSIDDFRFLLKLIDPLQFKENVKNSHNHDTGFSIPTNSTMDEDIDNNTMINNPEVDNIWYKMLSNTMQKDDEDSHFVADTPQEHEHMAPHAVNTNINNLATTDIDFDQLFGDPNVGFDFFDGNLSGNTLDNWGVDSFA